MLHQLLTIAQSTTNAGPVADPLIANPYARIGVIAAGYLVMILLSGRVVMLFIDRSTIPARSSASDGPKLRFGSSVIIGKCENIITMTFILAGEVTGLALIFAAKSWARGDRIKENPGFYLGGTLVNLVWGMLIAFIVRLLVIEPSMF
jgi:hypothetical protein